MKRSYYFLVTGQIIFHTTENEPGAMLVNAVVAHDTDSVPSRLIGKAQQALQLNFFKAVNDTTFTIDNVVITNWTNLGRMTEAYFHAAPEGTQLQEVPAGKNPFEAEAEAPVDTVN